MSETIDQLIDAFDTATTQAAKDVENLIAAIKATKGQVSADQEARAQGIIDHLRGLGADHANPVPEPETPPAPASEPGA